MNSKRTQACLALALMFGSTNAATAKYVTQRFDKVSFDAPADWGIVKGRKVSAVALANPSDMPDGVAPEHYEITFSKHPGTVCIYYLNNSAKPSFKKDFPPFPEAIAVLKRLLIDQPAKPKDIPHLPWGDETTYVCAKVAYLHCSNHYSECVRSLAEFQQDQAQITNEDLVYTAQGLSNDGAFYISFVCPIRAPGLPDKSTSANWSKDQWSKFSKGFRAYCGHANKTLDAADGSSFSPSLPELDHLVQSIAIAPYTVSNPWHRK